MLENPLPPVEQIHDASMHILEEIGIDFLDPEALAGIALAQLVSPGVPIIYDPAYTALTDPGYRAAYMV